MSPIVLENKTWAIAALIARANKSGDNAGVLKNQEGYSTHVA